MKVRVASLFKGVRQAADRRCRSPIGSLPGTSGYDVGVRSGRESSIVFSLLRFGDAKNVSHPSDTGSYTPAVPTCDRSGFFPFLSEVSSNRFATTSSSQGWLSYTFSPQTRNSLLQSDICTSPVRSLMTSSIYQAASTSTTPLPRVIPPGGFLNLTSLKDRPGARQNSKRLGRGIGSGKGKTAGRGHKGQKARAGRKPRIGFEGGQTPLRLTLPKRGFHNPFKLEYQVINLAKIRQKIKEGQIDSRKLITMKTLKDAGAIGKAMRDGVKLLGGGSTTWKLPLHIEVSRVSARAKEAIEAVGGSVVKVHYNKLGLRALYTPEWFAKKGRLLPKPARPPPSLVSQVDAIGRLPAPTELPTVTQTNA